MTGDAEPVPPRSSEPAGSAVVRALVRESRATVRRCAGLLDGGV
jgi:hypothetical protein